MTRAYFTAATCAISLFIILSIALNKDNFISKFKVEITPPQFLTIKKLHLQRKNISSNTDCKDIILWNDRNNSYFRIQKGILTKKIRDNFFITNFHKSIIVGLILSDGYIQKKIHWNPRIALKQSMKNFEYLWSVFHTLSVYCSSLPYDNSNIMRGKLFFNINFQTRQLKSLNEIYNLFYRKTKQILPELFHYMDYIVLAH